METSAQPILPGFKDPSPCSAPEFLASRRVWPGSEEARMMTVGSGRQLSMLLEQSSQLGAFSKILLESSHWGNSMEYCYVWNRLDTKFGLSAFRLTPLGQSTDGNGSSLLGTPNASQNGPNGQQGSLRQTIETRLWRTPNASDVTGGPMNGEVRLAPGHHLNLVEQAATPKLWPTPTGNDAKASGSRNTPQSNAHGGESLTDAARGDGGMGRLWLTPTVPNGGRRNSESVSITGKKPDGGKAQMDLREYAIRMLPTPTVQDGANNGAPSQMDRNSLSLNATFGGPLNPRFVEELMGFPIDHTALKRSATPLSPNKPTRSSKRSQRKLTKYLEELLARALD